MLKSVRLINFKSFDNLYLKFDSNVIYLNGPNGSGKSTIIEGIQLALLGYIPGHSKKLQDIFRFSSNNHIMEVSVSYEVNGSEFNVKRRYENTGGKISCIIDKFDIDDVLSSFDPNIELPVFNFKEFLQLSSNKQKQWLLDFIQNSDEKYNIDWETEIEDAIFKNNLIPDEGLVNELISEFDNEIDPDLLKSYNLEIKDRISEEKSIQSSSEKTLQETELSLLEYPSNTVTDTSSISDKLYCLTEKLSKLKYSKKILEENYHINEKLKGYKDLPYKMTSDETYIETSKEIKDILKSLYDKKERLEEINNQINSLKHNLLSSDYGDKCPIIHEPCEQLCKYRATVEEENIKLQRTVANLEIEKSKLLEEISSLKDSLNDKNKQLENISNRYLERDSLLKSLILLDENVDQVSIDRDLSELEKEVSELQSTLNLAIEYRSLLELSKKMETQKLQSKIRLDILKVVDKLTGPNGLQSKLGSSSMVKFISNLSTDSKILYDGSEIYIDIENTKSNSFDFGIIKDSNKISFETLSSGEKCIYMIILLSNILKISSTTKVLLVDDVFDHLDDENIKRIFDYTRNNKDIQYIFAGYQTIAKDESLNKYVIDVKRLKE